MKERGQGMVEFALLLSFLLILLGGMISFAVVLSDYGAASDSAQKAAHAAAIFFVDGSRKSCYDRAIAAAGNPNFLMAKPVSFTIAPCDTNPDWIGPSRQPVTATWVISVNPPIPFVYDTFGFPITLTVVEEDYFR
mgnify:CR=1 FL=1